MARMLLFGGGAIALVVATFSWQSGRSSSSETVFAGKTKPPEASPVCPWREPETDLKSFFPEAKSYELQTCALSGLRLQLTEQLGRPPTPDENLLHIYCINGQNGPVGAVLTRRVKGTHGAIEIVVAADGQGRVRGLRLQRMREPENVARILKNAEWLRSFKGKSAKTGWEIGRDTSEVPVEARGSAAAIAEGTRSSLILLAASSQAVSQTPIKSQHH